MLLSIQFNVYFDGKVMSTYQQKKKHIYAYRRRKRAQNCINKLAQIIEESSPKDLDRLMKLVNDLWAKIIVELGWLDNIDFRREARESAIDRKIRMGESRLADPLAYYVCRKCGRKGYLFSPNLDEYKLDVYMLHILWPERKVEFCYLGRSKIDQILIQTPPIEGILAFH